MNKDEILIQSIENIRGLVNNSIQILKDMDTYFSDKGFVPFLGNNIGAESSKSINQSFESMGTFFPQYMFRPYVDKKELDSGNVSKIAAVNIQYFHPKHDLMTPILISGVFRFPEPVKDPKSAIKIWWLKYTVLEYNLSEKFNYGEVDNAEPFSDDKTTVDFWSQPLTSLENQSDVRDVVGRLVGIYNQ